MCYIKKNGKIKKQIKKINIIKHTGVVFNNEKENEKKGMEAGDWGDWEQP